MSASGPGGEQGLLAIASPDADRFNPTMSTDYLARIGERPAFQRAAKKGDPDLVPLLA